MLLDSIYDNVRGLEIRFDQVDEISYQPLVHVRVSFLRYEDNEVREQVFLMDPHRRGWRETTERRLMNWDPDTITPMVIIPGVVPTS